MQNKGIDYSGFSGVNRDKETGIRYGIIPQNDCNSDAIGDIFSNGRDLGFENFQAEFKRGIESALSEYPENPAELDTEELSKRLKKHFDDYFFSRQLDGAVSDAMEQITDYAGDLNSKAESIFAELEDRLNDGHMGESGPHYYENDGYALQTDDDGDLWIIKSPYFTHAAFCSPCAPGACHLRNPLELPDPANKCYCLGHDWFDDGKAPYPVYSIATGKQIVASEQNVKCLHCDNGRRSLADLAKVRQCEVYALDIPSLNLSNVHDGAFDCLHCQAKGFTVETVYSEK